MAYCNADDVKQAANRWTDLGTSAATRVAAAITQAQRFVDQQTGTFFEQRTLQVVTEPISNAQKRLFMPAPVIALTSVTEGGTDITTSVFNYVKWLEKNAGLVGVPFPGDPPTPNYWLYQQQSVVILGTFGFAATPDDIVAVTAFIAASLLGWVEKSYVDANGLSYAFRDNVFPPWVQQTIDDRKFSPFDVQPMIVSTP